jgi:hypothetical protein
MTVQRSLRRGGDAPLYPLSPICIRAMFRPQQRIEAFIGAGSESEPLVWGRGFSCFWSQSNTKGSRLSVLCSQLVEAPTLCEISEASREQ